MTSKTPALVLLLLPALLSLISGTHGVCYFPDGSVANGDVPCQSTGNSTCCGEGYACLSNNICQATGDELQLPEATEYVRGSCTDPTWRSASCPSFCITEAENSGAGIIRCNTTEQLYYCTGDQNNATDCATGQNVFYFPGNATVLTTIGVTPTSSISSATSTPSTAAVISSLPQTVPPPIPANSPSSDNGAIIGGAVGGGAGGVAIIALAAWLFARRRRRPAETTASEADHAGEEEEVHEAPSGEAFKKPQRESNTDLSEVQELPAPNEDPDPPQELPVPKQDSIPPQELPA